MRPRWACAPPASMATPARRSHARTVARRLLEAPAFQTSATADHPIRCGDREVEHHHVELFLITRALDALRDHVSPDRQRELIGPTWLLDAIIREAAIEVAERLRGAVDRFRADGGAMTADELRAALETACASTATLIGLDFAQNHAME